MRDNARVQLILAPRVTTSVFFRLICKWLVFGEALDCGRQNKE